MNAWNSAEANLGGEVALREPTKTGYEYRPYDGILTVAQSIVRVQRAVLEYHESGVADAGDPEHLHEFRIALRRLRSALRVFGSYLPEGEARLLKNGLRRIAAATTKARDADVLRADAERIARKIGAASPSVRLALLALLEAESRVARAQLAEVLAGGEYEQVKRQLEVLGQAASSGPARCIVDEEPKLLRRALTRLRRKTRAVRRGAPAEAYHELRKELKHYRYTCEFFRILHAQRWQRRIRRLDRLQLLTGRLQDARLERDLLLRFEDALAPRDPAPPTISPEARPAVLARLRALDERLPQLEKRVRKKARRLRRKLE